MHFINFSIKDIIDDEDMSDILLVQSAHVDPTISGNITLTSVLSIKEIIASQRMTSV